MNQSPEVNTPIETNYQENNLNNTFNERPNILLSSTMYNVNIILIIILDFLFRLSMIFIIVQSCSIMSIGTTDPVIIGLFVFLISLMLLFIGIISDYIEYLNLHEYFKFAMTFIGRFGVIMFLGFIVRYTTLDNNWNKFVFGYNVVVSFTHLVFTLYTNYLYYFLKHHLENPMIMETKPFIKFPTI